LLARCGAVRRWRRPFIGPKGRFRGGIFPATSAVIPARWAAAAGEVNRGAVWMEPVVQGRPAVAAADSDVGWVVACSDGGVRS
jgi:hypothetical protein